MDEVSIKSESQKSEKDHRFKSLKLENPHLSDIAINNAPNPSEIKEKLQECQ